MRTLYFDCFAGASGNMILGGLAALGVDRGELVRQLSTVTPVSYVVEFKDVMRSGIATVHAKVTVPDERNHRHLGDIEKIIDASEVFSPVKNRSKSIFRRLAEAESKVHGVEVNKIHFHEVGAMDAIVDVVGACIGFEMLGIERFVCSKIHVGSGFIDIAHGKFPVPPPAVVELLRGFPFYSSEIQGELATPTGIAIITTICEGVGISDEISIDDIGYGAGTREYDKFPNVLRMTVGESDPLHEGEKPKDVVMLETNIDDLSPQILGFVMERALELGALDCWFTPIQMKKNRPAVMLSILCDRENRPALTELVYKETSTLGIRIRSVDRDCLAREFVRVGTAYGDLDVKVGSMNGKVLNAMPEYEQVKRVALESGVAFRLVRDAALAAFNSGRSRSAAT